VPQLRPSQAQVPWRRWTISRLAGPVVGKQGQNTGELLACTRPCFNQSGWAIRQAHRHQHAHHCWASVMMLARRCSHSGRTGPLKAARTGLLKGCPLHVVR